MKNSERDIASEFWDFEPETGSAHIDRSWEKIKYFLPQERKRRGFFFFLTNGRGRSSLFLLLTLVVAGYIAMYFLNSDSETPKKTSLKTGPTNRTHEKNKTSLQIKAATKKNHSKSIKTNLNTKSALSLSVKAIKNNKTKTESKQAVPSEQQKKTPENKFPLTVQGETTKVQAIGNAAENSSEPHSEKPETDSVVYLNLEPVSFWDLSHLPRPDSLRNVLMPVQNPWLPASLKNKIMLEFLGGLNESFTSVQYNNSGDAVKHRQANLSAGLGILYEFKNKWNLNVNIIASQDKQHVNFETNGNKIVSTETTVIAITSLIPDTLYKYVILNSTNAIRTKSSYFGNLGLGYKLVQRRGFGVDVFAQLSLRYTVYSLSSTNQQGPDTLTYLKGPGSKPFTNSVKGFDGEYIQEQKILKLGLSPGINFSYALRRRTSLLLKFAYVFPFSKDQLNTERADFMTARQNAFISLGIRQQIVN